MPETIIDKHFVLGLRNDARMQNNTEHLTRCYGMRATEHGLVKEASIVDGTDGAAVVWPLPQMFRGESFTLCLKDDILQYEDANQVLQTVPVFEPAASGSELMADTDMSSWDDTATRWTIAGTTATCAAGASTQSIIDTLGGALTSGRLYRFVVNVSAVTTAESSDDRMRVSIGPNVSLWQVPRVGVMEFDVYATVNTDMDEVAIECEKSVSAVISGTSLKLIAQVTDLGLVSTDKPFHMVSFGKIWFLVGDSMLLMCAPMCGTAGRLSSDANYVFNWRVVRWTGTKLRAMAAFNERLYIAGFDAADGRYNTAEFTSAFDIFMKSHTGAMYESFEVAKNVLFYGNFLGGDVNWPFAADLALFGLLDNTQSADFKDVYNASLREGNQGFIRLPTQGRILRMERLGAALLCYCEDSLVLVQTSPENPNLHGARVISPNGLGDNGLVCCGEDFHMYVAANGKLQLVSGDYSVRELGYEEFLATFIANKSTAPPIALYDQDKSEAYFGNGALQYVYSRGGGMGEVWTAITSFHQSYTTGLKGSRVSIAPSNGKARIKTGATDFGNRVFKFIHDLEIGAHDVTNLRVRVLYKNDHSTTWQAGEWHEVIRGGFTLPLTSGYEFQFELEFTPGASARIEYIKVNWQIRDNRNFRRQAGRI